MDGGHTYFDWAVQCILCLCANMLLCMHFSSQNSIKDEGAAAMSGILCHLPNLSTLHLWWHPKLWCLAKNVTCHLVPSWPFCSSLIHIIKLGSWWCLNGVYQADDWREILWMKQGYSRNKIFRQKKIIPCLNFYLRDQKLGFWIKISEWCFLWKVDFIAWFWQGKRVDSHGDKECCGWIMFCSTTYLPRPQVIVAIYVSVLICMVWMAFCNKLVLLCSATTTLV